MACSRIPETEFGGEANTVEATFVFSVHPAADLFPLMPDDELDELAEDIKNHGQQNPIVLSVDGQLLDGRNRVIACERAGVEPKTRTLTGGDPVAFIISMNLKRRHLDTSQRAMIAVGIANLSEGRPLKTPANEGVSQTTAAGLMDVGVASVERAAVVCRNGAQNVIAMVRQGEVSVSAAAEAVKAAPKSEQETWTPTDVKNTARRRRRSAKLKQLGPPVDPPVPQAINDEIEAALSESETELDSIDASIAPAESSTCQGDLFAMAPHDNALGDRFSAFADLVRQLGTLDVPSPGDLEKLPPTIAPQIRDSLMGNLPRAIAVLAEYQQSLQDVAGPVPK
jgi:ParB-like nuclease domain